MIYSRLNNSLSFKLLTVPLLGLLGAVLTVHLLRSVIDTVLSARSFEVFLYSTTFLIEMVVLLAPTYFLGLYIGWRTWPRTTVIASVAANYAIVVLGSTVTMVLLLYESAPTEVEFLNRIVEVGVFALTRSLILAVPVSLVLVLVIYALQNPSSKSLEVTTDE